MVGISDLQTGWPVHLRWEVRETGQSICDGALLTCRGAGQSIYNSLSYRYRDCPTHLRWYSIIVGQSIINGTECWVGQPMYNGNIFLLANHWLAIYKGILVHLWWKMSLNMLRIWSPFFHIWSGSHDIANILILLKIATKSTPQNQAIWSGIGTYF